MCCLKYEEFAYEDLVKHAPKSDSFVETPSGKGSVVSVNLLRRSAKVRLEDGMDTTLKTFSFDELDILGGKARRAEYITARAEGRLEEAGFTAPKPIANVKSDFSSPRTPSDAPPRPQSDSRNRRSPGRPQTPKPNTANANAPRPAPPPRPAQPRDNAQQTRPAQGTGTPAAPAQSSEGAPKKPNNNNRRRKSNWRGKGNPGQPQNPGAGKGPEQ
jgi:hypothetical protein